MEQTYGEDRCACSQVRSICEAGPLLGLESVREEGIENLSNTCKAEVGGGAR